MKRIIIIDDDPGIQDSAHMIFRKPDYEVTIYPDGTSIMSGDFEVPDIFIIDKQLPGMDGLDLCRHLKQQPSTKYIPIIIMSASAQTNKLAKIAGAEEFIEKPYTLKIMRDLINKYLNG